MQSFNSVVWEVIEGFFSLIAAVWEVQDDVDMVRPFSTTQCNPSQLPTVTRKKKDVRAHCHMSPDTTPSFVAEILANLRKMGCIRALASILCLL